MPRPQAAEAMPPPQPATVARLSEPDREPPARAIAGQVQRPVPVPGDRFTLARELQRELRRVGCYDGEVNGVWGTSTRRAMKAFTDHVNASLPIDQPDYVLLAMVQGHGERACGGPCPAGETAAADGRCIPNAILAGASKRLEAADPKPSQSATEAATSITVSAPTAAAVATPMMALAGPKGEPSAPAATEDRARVSAARPSPAPEAAEDETERRSGRSERRQRKQVRRAPSQQGAYARSVFRSIQRAMRQFW